MLDYKFAAVIVCQFVNYFYIQNPREGTFQHTSSHCFYKLSCGFFWGLQIQITCTLEYCTDIVHIVFYKISHQVYKLSHFATFRPLGGCLPKRGQRAGRQQKTNWLSWFTWVKVRLWGVGSGAGAWHIVASWRPGRWWDVWISKWQGPKGAKHVSGPHATASRAADAKVRGASEPKAPVQPLREGRTCSNLSLKAGRICFSLSLSLSLSLKKKDKERMKMFWFSSCRSLWVMI